MERRPNKAYGAHLQPFSGIPTFMRLPAHRELADVDVVVAGFPFDSGTSYRSGTRFGPRKIREASLMLWGYNTFFEVAPIEALTVVDYGDAEVIPVDILATQEAITREVSAILAQDVTLLSLGGDHSISLPLLRAHADKYGPLAVIHFDSHIDTWEQEYEGFPHSHGTPFYWALREGLIDTEAYIQIGIRGPTSGPDDLNKAREMGARVITIDEAFTLGVDAVLELAHSLVGDRAVYVSLDIDAVDPSYAPGTGTPEVGGFTSYQMLQLLRGLRGLNLIGMDLVEVDPSYDHGEITSILAANLAFEFLSLLAVKDDSGDASKGD